MYKYINMNSSTIEQSQNGKPFSTQSIDKVVDMYNDLWLNMRSNKNTLSKWISNLFDKTEEIDNRVSDIENQLEDLKREIRIEIYEELKEELIMEIRTEMRS